MKSKNVNYIILNMPSDIDKDLTKEQSEKFIQIYKDTREIGDEQLTAKILETICNKRNLTEEEKPLFMKFLIDINDAINSATEKDDYKIIENVNLN